LSFFLSFNRTRLVFRERSPYLEDSTVQNFNIGSQLLIRFRIELSDIDRGVYENLDLRVAMHPSETHPYLLTRVLAFALNAEEGLEFAPGGLSDTDDPAIRKLTLHGSLELAIEIGSPSAKRLHRTAKAAEHTKVFTYKDASLLLKEMAAAGIHRLNEIEFYSFDSKFLDRLAQVLEKDNRWTLIHQDGHLSILSDGNTGDAIEGDVRRERPE
jgi:uncharacterized protein YaeQ